MKKQKFDLVVLGSGPGGYVAAIRAAQQGLNTALIEAREIGGTCLNRGCIPSKTLIANAEVLHKLHEAAKYGIHAENISFDYSQMKTRKDQVVDDIRTSLEGLIRANKITIIQGYGKFVSPHEIKVTGHDEAWIEADQFIVATGSEPLQLPSLPYDYERVHDSTSLLNITKLPKRLLIVGGGVIGCEFACLHNAFDVDVTIVELLPEILSMEGPQVASFMRAELEKQGITIQTEVAVTKIEKTKKYLIAHLTDGSTIESDIALIAVGRKFNTDNIGIEHTGVVVEPNGSIETNERLETNVPHIYAIGDITAKWILAHVASHQGMVAADNIAGHHTKINYNAVPSVIFTKPEVGTIGLTLERAIEEGYDATIGKFPFQALGKSQAAIETAGFAQVVIDKKTGEILGAQVIGYGAATLIAEMAVAIGNELTIESISDTIHAHPTIAEAWMEAALLAQETPLHLPPKRKKS